MTEGEYNDKLTQIETDCNTKKKALYCEYGMSQAIFKKGDIIKDHRWTIKIQKITTYKYFGKPGPAYHGIELKKDLTPKKSGDVQSIYGNDGAELVKLGCTES